MRRVSSSLPGRIKVVLDPIAQKSTLISVQRTLNPKPSLKKSCRSNLQAIRACNCQSAFALYQTSSPRFVRV